MNVWQISFEVCSFARLQIRSEIHVALQKQHQMSVDWELYFLLKRHLNDVTCWIARIVSIFNVSTDVWFFFSSSSSKITCRILNRACWLKGDFLFLIFYVCKFFWCVQCQELATLLCQKLHPNGNQDKTSERASRITKRTSEVIKPPTPSNQWEEFLMGFVCINSTSSMCCRSFLLISWRESDYHYKICRIVILA